MINPLKQSKIISELSEMLYSYLPGAPHPYANRKISFQGIADDLDLSKFWMGGSKKPAISNLIEYTLKYEQRKFCDLIIEIVKRGIRYRESKNPITKEEIEIINEHVKELGFKIPDLWDKEFLISLPSSELKKEKIQEEKGIDYDELKKEFLELRNLQPQKRGYEFEKYLNKVFQKFNLNPRPSFRLIGEQIDGSFQIGDDTYLLEAKWQNEQANEGDLLKFKGKIDSKAVWSRGLFISYSGFSKDGLEAFEKVGATNIIGITGEDLFLILERKISLLESVNRKVQHAAETGEFYKSILQLI